MQSFSQFATLKYTELYVELYEACEEALREFRWFSLGIRD